MKGKLPRFYATLTEEQMNGDERITEPVPEVYWVYGNGVAHTLRVEEPERARWGNGISPRSHRYSPRQMILTWRRLAALGYQPTTKANYRATLAHLRRCGDAGRALA